MLIRVAESGKPGYQLRKGEDGLSVFDTEAVQPPLSEDEILSAFRPGSVLIPCSSPEVEAKGLTVVPIPGSDALPARLRAAHAEIRPGQDMPRGQFKKALQELE